MIYKKNEYENFIDTTKIAVELRTIEYKVNELPKIPAKVQRVSKHKIFLSLAIGEKKNE